MKIFVFAAIGLMLIAGLVVAYSVQEDEIVQESVVTEQLNCDGSCSAGNSCSNPTCGVNVGDGCGCGK